MTVPDAVQRQHDRELPDDAQDDLDEQEQREEYRYWHQND